MNRFIKHISVFLLGLFVGGCLMLSAQDALSNPSDDPVMSLATDLGRSNVSFDYKYVMNDGNVNMRGGGSLTVQESCYFIEGDGLKIWCDGSSVWTFDVMEDEVVIESADAVGGFAANPLLIIAHCADLYSWDAKGRSTTFGGVACKEFTLTPKAKVEFTGVKLYIANRVLVGAEMSMSKNTLSFTITSYKSRPVDHSAVFVPDAFSEDCIITDLR